MILKISYGSLSAITLSTIILSINKLDFYIKRIDVELKHITLHILENKFVFEMLKMGAFVSNYYVNICFLLSVFSSDSTECVPLRRHLHAHHPSRRISNVFTN